MSHNRQESLCFGGASPVINLTSDVHEASASPQEGSSSPSKSISGSSMKEEDEKVVDCEDCRGREELIEKVRQEFGCAICLDLCYKPCATPCGHLFCESCLDFSLKKSGMTCPKCHQNLKFGGDGLSINTSIWNIIQLLFPKEIFERETAVAQEKENEKRKRYCFGKKSQATHDLIPVPTWRDVTDSEFNRSDTLHEDVPDSDSVQPSRNISTVDEENLHEEL